MLLKFALILGVEFIENITFEEICPRNLIRFNISGNSEQVCNVEGECTSFPPETKSSVTGQYEMVAVEEGMLLPGCELKRKLCASSNENPSAISGLEQKITDTNPSNHHHHHHHNGDPSATKEGSEVDGNVCFGGKKKSKNSLPLSHHQYRYSNEDEEDAVIQPASSFEEGNSDPPRMKKASLKSNTGRLSADESSDETSSSSENDIKETRSETLFKGTDEEGIKVRECEEGRSKCNENYSCFCCCHLHLKNDYDWKNSDNYVGALAHFAINSKNPATASPYVDYEKILSKLHSFQFDVVLGADGRRNTLSDNFPRKEFRGRLAIAITANFVNTHTLIEAQIPEISGISFIYNQQLFR